MARERKKHTQTRQRTFEQWQAFEEKQQRREIEDLSFYEGEGQWPSDIANARSGQPAQNGMPAVPGRPMITVNKVREPIRHVVNEERAADLGVEIIPADDLGLTQAPITPEEIELREGLVRRIQRESHAIDARIWAAERATIAGRGYYGVMTRYLPGKTNDQDIYVRRFYDQGGILLDPAHEEPDGSDAEGAFVPTWMPYEEYRVTYPKRANGKPNSLGRLGEADFKTLSGKLTHWFSVQNDFWRVRVVEYWSYDRVRRGLATLQDGSVWWEDELSPLQRDQIQDVRDVIDKQVKYCLLDGYEDDDTPLEETDWLGKYIPIIKIVGEEMQPFDAQRRFEGMVRPARDSQRGFNYMVSKWVEMIGLTPVPPLMMVPQHIEGFTDMYASMATRNWPYLLYNGTDPITNQPLPPPVRPPVQTDIQAVAGSVQLFDAAIRATTAVPDPTLGNVDPAIKSGRGIQALTMNALKATAHFGDNFQRSVNYEGRILNDLLYPIYGRRLGRMARIYTAQRETKTIAIGAPQGPPTMTQPQKTYTLTPDVEFTVAIKVTKNYDTLREQEASTIMEAVNTAPEFMLPLVGDLLFKYQDGPGHQELADRVKLGLRPEVQAQMNGQPTDPRMQQLQAENQQLKQMLQSGVAEEQAKQQATTQRELAKTQIQEAAEDRRNRENNETKLAVAELGAKVDRLTLFLEERERLGIQAHERQMSELEHQQALEQQAHQASIASQQAHQQAALNPPEGAA